MAQSISCTKSSQVLCRKSTYMLTGLKGSSLACKCVFCKPEHNSNPMKVSFEGLEIQKWNIAMDRAQIVHEKNGVICLVIMFTPNVMELWSLKCQKWLIFCIYCWWQRKFTHILGNIFKGTWKISLSFFRKCYG